MYIAARQMSDSKHLCASASEHNEPPGERSLADSAYWDEYYSHRHPGISDASTFAHFSAERMSSVSTIYELGCGNGRDALYFAERGHRVFACDRSHVAIEHLEQTVAGLSYRHRPTLVVGEMGKLPDIPDPLDVVYSRFSLHAVSAEEASMALSWTYRNLGPGGRLFAEARSVLGSLFGLGVEVARDTFLHNEHTRRFLRREELVAELEQLGFAIHECIESDGLAVYKDDDPVVIRVIAVKRG
jgi:tellurite methyltransferase